MAVTVFVWTDSDTGHAALSIDGRETSKTDPYAHYISFYPDPERTNSEEATKAMTFGGIPGRATSINQNTRPLQPPPAPCTISEANNRDKAVRKRLPSYVSAPITCVDDDAIVAFWASFRAANPRWSLTKNNCADVVRDALVAGGASKVSLNFRVQAANPIITPTSLIPMAKALTGEKDIE